MAIFFVLFVFRPVRMFISTAVVRNNFGILTFRGNYFVKSIKKTIAVKYIIIVIIRWRHRRRDRTARAHDILLFLMSTSHLPLCPTLLLRTSPVTGAYALTPNNDGIWSSMSTFTSVACRRVVTNEPRGVDPIWKSDGRMGKSCFSVSMLLYLLKYFYGIHSSKTVRLSFSPTVDRIFRVQVLW